MYEDIFCKIRNEAEMRNLKESTINAYCNSVDYFLRIVNKDVSALTTNDVEAFLTEKRLGEFMSGGGLPAFPVFRILDHDGPVELIAARGIFS